MKKIFLFLFFLISLGIFAGLIFLSSPYRELRPYSVFGSKIRKDKNVPAKSADGQTLVLISGIEGVEDFYIGQIPITVGAYKDCTATGGCLTHHFRDSYTHYYESDIYDIFPMTFVTFDEARAYCLAYGGDLPTEAQWEAAAGPGVYAWGDRNPTLSRANLDGFYQSHTPAGWLPEGASPFGVLDMTGNVREWVLDENPENPSEIALKGGGFQDPFNSGKNASAFYHDPTSSGFNRGFRCVFSKSEIRNMK
ncbi:MAG: SUMF1/EgtB/PvdO family nonheme iron enzyme [Flexilinea sp.]|nr:SUMF1/EgtB/PvdO family nonheme iron enzyme [Flexilinea sp.]